MDERTELRPIGGFAVTFWRAGRHRGMEPLTSRLVT
jgi:hypothetical protein